MSDPLSDGAPGFPKAAVTRRAFLGGTAAVSLLGVMGGHDGWAERLMSSLAPEGLESTSTHVYSFSVERPMDMVQLDITLTGFKPPAVVKGGGQLLELQPQSGSYITVQFPPQCVGEAAYPYVGQAAYPYSGPPWNVDPPPVLSAMSGPSRLCFTTTTPITFSTPMSVVDLLDWSSWTLLVPAVIAPKKLTSARPNLTAAPNVTFIEYPYALYLSPAVVEASAQPGAALPQPAMTFSSFYGIASSTGVTDCWTASLVPSGAEVPPNIEVDSSVGLSMVAVWADDYTPIDATPTKNDTLPVIQIAY